MSQTQNMYGPLAAGQMPADAPYRRTHMQGVPGGRSMPMGPPAGGLTAPAQPPAPPGQQNDFGQGMGSLGQGMGLLGKSLAGGGQPQGMLNMAGLTGAQPGALSGPMTPGAPPEGGPPGMQGAPPALPPGMQGGLLNGAAGMMGAQPGALQGAMTSGPGGLDMPMSLEGMDPSMLSRLLAMFGQK